MVPAPSPISPAPDGSRPSTVENSSGPRIDRAATVPTLFPSMDTGVATPRVIWSMAWLWVSTWTNAASDWPGLTVKLSW